MIIYTFTPDRLGDGTRVTLFPTWEGEASYHITIRGKEVRISGYSSKQIPHVDCCPTVRAHDAGPCKRVVYSATSVLRTKSTSILHQFRGRAKIRQFETIAIFWKGIESKREIPSRLLVILICRGRNKTMYGIFRRPDEEPCTTF